MTKRTREQRLMEMCHQLAEALSEWPCGWHNPAASGGLHFQVDYTVAKARRMGKLHDKASALLVEMKAGEGQG